jgi:hypothetical protein
MATAPRRLAVDVPIIGARGGGYLSELCTDVLCR